jgi:hypothetical protein
MKGSDPLLMLILTLLFAISHIWFIFFLSAMIKKGTNGRSITIILLIIVSFFSTLHEQFTLHESNSSEAIKHVFSIIPISAYELVLMGMYDEALNSQPPIKWGDLNRDISYRPIYGLLWLLADSVLYFLLFALMNLTMPRQFGAPPLGWRGLFSRKAWMRMFHSEASGPAPSSVVSRHRGRTLLHSPEFLFTTQFPVF